MWGGSLTRYHIPSMRRKGFSRELVKIAGITLLKSIGRGLQAYEKGVSFEDALSSSGQFLKKGLKRKLPAAATALAESAVKQSYKKKRQRVKDLFGV